MYIVYGLLWELQCDYLKCVTYFRLGLDYFFFFIEFVGIVSFDMGNFGDCWCNSTDLLAIFDFV